MTPGMYPIIKQRLTVLGCHCVSFILGLLRLRLLKRLLRLYSLRFGRPLLQRLFLLTLRRL